MADYVQVERHEGVFTPTGETVRFKKTWGANEHWPGKTFTDDEIVQLLDGELIRFQAISKNNKPYAAAGRLGQGTFNGNTFWGFQLDTSALPESFLGHKFTAAEMSTLESGGEITVEGLVGKSEKPFTGILRHGVKDGETDKSLILTFPQK